MRKKEDIDFKYNIKVYWGLLRNYKPLLLGLFIIGIILAGSLTVSKFLFKVIVDRGTEFTNHLLGKEEFIHILLIVAVIYIISRLLRTIAQWLNVHLLNSLDSKLMFDLKEKFFNHIIHLSHNFHNSHKTGSLISRIMRGSSAIERMTDIIVFNVFPLFFELVVVGGSLLYFSKASGLAVAITAVVFILYSLFIQQIQKEANIIANKTNDIEKANLSDFMTNIDSIKYYGKENYVKLRFKRLIEKTKNALVRHWNYYRWFDAGHGIILALGTFFVVYFPLVAFLEGNLSLGTIVFIYTVFGDIMGPLFGFVHGIRNFYSSMADFEVLFQYKKVENEIKDKKDAINLKIKYGEIEFKNVSFRYHKKQGLLNNFNLKINKNQKIAFVGHSGSGKSTLVKLLYRLYDVDSGEILIDGIDIKNVKQETLRSELSIVPQECILFDDSIYKNIKFSNSNASKEDVTKAMKFAQLDKLVANLPKKDQTVVGERGVKLSGGEKQRVSIARAILANKKILVLDEATSSLDSQTEHEIQKDLERLMKNRTSIIIAHRLSTIMRADLIVVLKKGRIVQKGTHNQLIKQEGEYRKLWSLQKGGYLQ